MSAPTSLGLVAGLLALLSAAPASAQMHDQENATPRITTGLLLPPDTTTTTGAGHASAAPAAPSLIISSLPILAMQRFEDDTDDQLRTVLKADEYARVQAKRAAHKRAYRPGRRPNK